MKKIIYVSALTFLGILLQFLVHAGVEIVAINLLTSDFETYGLGLGWDQWFLIHHIGAVFLFAAGVVLGFWQGRYWWSRLCKKD